MNFTAIFKVLQSSFRFHIIERRVFHLYFRFFNLAFVLDISRCTLSTRFVKNYTVESFHSNSTPRVILNTEIIVMLYYFLLIILMPEPCSLCILYSLDAFYHSPCHIGHCRNVRGLGKSMVVFRLFEKLRSSNERSTKFGSLYHE